MSAQLRFAKLHLNRAEDFWNNAHAAAYKQRVLLKPNTAFQHKHLIPTVQQGGRGVMICACFAAMGTGHLAVTESTINSSEH